MSSPYSGLLFRVHRKDGFQYGPFNDIDQDEILGSSFSRARFPTPFSDGIVAYDGHCACQSLRLLREWFYYTPARRRLRGGNWYVSVFRVPPSYVSVGRRQVLVRSVASRFVVLTMEFTQFWKEADADPSRFEDGALS